MSKTPLNLLQNSLAIFSYLDRKSSENVQKYLCGLQTN